MEIEFRFDPDRLTVAEYIAIEELAGGIKTPTQVRVARNLLAAFMVGSDGEMMDKEAAQAELDRLTLGGLFECIAAFMEQRNRQVDEAVLPNGSDAG